MESFVGPNYPLAKCKDVENLDLFFPDVNTRIEPSPQEKECMAICRTCSHQLECLVDALDRQERYGVWGGATEKMRIKMTRKQLITLSTARIGWENGEI